jgi:hypothetical protein
MESEEIQKDEDMWAQFIALKERLKLEDLDRNLYADSKIQEDHFKNKTEARSCNLWLQNNSLIFNK